MQRPQSKIPVIDYLYSLAYEEKQGNKAILAHLKRHLGNTENWTIMFKHLGRYIKDETNDQNIRINFLIAGLFATHQKATKDDISIAKSFRNIITDNNSNSYERRFEIFLNSDREELPDRLTSLINLMKDEAINYENLYNDIKFWNEEKKYKLAKDFWAK